LRDGKCIAKKSFRDGDYIIDIWLWDDAGNSNVYDVGFRVEY